MNEVTPLASLYTTQNDTGSTSTAAQRPVISLEFFPPKKQENIAKTKDLIAGLSEFNVAYMTVTYGAGGSTRSFTQEIATFIQQEIRARAICHVTCVNHSRGELRSLLSSLADVGIRDILALRGDAPTADNGFVPHPDGFSCARDLIHFIDKEYNFSICAAGYPETHREAVSAQADITYLRQKVDAGASVILTQLFFDPAVYFDFVIRCRAAGITIPIVPGVMPIRDYVQLQKFTSMCGATIPTSLQQKLEKIKDNRGAVIEFGTQYALALCQQLLAGGAPGIHLYTLNQSDQVFKILNAL